LSGNNSVENTQLTNISVGDNSDENDNQDPEETPDIELQAITALPVEPSFLAVAITDEEDPQEMWPLYKKRFAFALCVTAIIIIVIAVPVTLEQTKPKTEPPANSSPTTIPTHIPTNNPSSSPSMAPTTTLKSIMRQKLENVSGKEVFDNRSSAQYKAFNWIYNDKIVMDAPNFIQRYVLAVFYYSTGGDNWKYCHREDKVCKDRKVSYLSPENECEWFGNVCVDGKINQLNFGTSEGNNLQGTLPNEISELKNMIILILINNKLTGSIINSIGNLHKLVLVYIRNNQFMGQIPQSFGNMTSLRELDISDNMFTGSIPTEFGKLSNLERVYMNNNYLNGTVPDEIFDIRPIQHLYLSNNTIMGTISDRINGLSNLRELLIDGNFISGTIPDALGNIQHLRYASFQRNNISGVMPSTICSGKEIKHDLVSLACDCLGDTPEVNCTCCTKCF